MAVVDSVAVKGAVWLAPLLLFRRQLPLRDAFRGSFPWMACMVILCIVTAFLHTVRLLNGLQNTHVFFDPMYIVFSVSAGVIEELSFRGGFFRLHERQIGFWPAALVNGALFTLYHYSELLLGRWQGLFSLRTLLLFAMGVIFCWMFKRWRNLELNMAVHTFWNIMSYLFCLTG